MDFTAEIVAPKVIANFDDVKNELSIKLNEYKGLVVTEATLGASKDAQKELASMRVKVDTFRKDKKRELEAPIKEFENKCKELIALIEETEKPLKDGIAVYDNQRREEKRQIALGIIDKYAEELGLSDEYKAKLTVIDKYLNLTAKVSDVESDLYNRAYVLRAEQDREQERIDIVQSIIDAENTKLTAKISIEDYKYQLSMGVNTTDIIKDVRDRASRIYESENAKPSAPQPVTEVKPSTDSKTYKVVYEVIGSYDELKAVSSFLKSNGIAYKVTSQQEV